ncbi:protein phosphatase 5 [Babesia microti strain RI]|uniref:Serine/threonine-protein phosphatase n=1 Tax=Babesia microti (strain RI) TaxID=1133968 RepID=A0A1N6LWE3_BABMR|nr:protein phosphatase 5 [Babesia microti strain RI]SIO73197.1 protein phosphatase 5 [Babesia microti strain RI]|eukprot:XP_021337305.1 protein phosphatase 5 [Babesia microti strain RI]
MASAAENADEFKKRGNAAFSENNYARAIDLYTSGINCLRESTSDLESTNLHIFYTNRALCHIRMENHGLAILDSEEAISLKPTYGKAYYRRGCAYLCLLKFKSAESDFVRVMKLSPDGEVRKKLHDCRQLLRQELFALAIKKDERAMLYETFNPQDIFVDSHYKGPVFDAENCGPEFLQKLIDFIKVPGNIFHRKFLAQVIIGMIHQLKKLKSVVHINVPKGREITICGDIHGQFYDLLNIFKINGMPSDSNPYIFNGDFVDRGSFSVECAVVLYVAKTIYPNSFHIIRGNHETEAMNKCYGFKGEMLSKYDDKLYTLFSESFCFLPLSYIINGKIFIVHGGLFSDDGIKIEQLENINRVMEPSDEGLMTEMLWSDPKPTPGRSPSKRGVGCEFGPDVTQEFLKTNNLSLIIRSHEVRQNGYQMEHGGKLITIFSAPNYCDQMDNKGALIRINGNDLKPKFVQFEAVEHPPIEPMRYANSMFSGIL